MPPRQPVSELATHEVSNQPPPLTDYNLFDADPILCAALVREGAAWAGDRVAAFGATLGSERIAGLAEAANRYPPELRIFDRFGQRLDEVSFHPAYHELMALAKTHAVHSIAWTAPQSGGHVAHMALEYLLVQAEAGVCCPITMTSASVAVLKNVPNLAADWLPRVLALTYDPRFLPASEKTGLTIGMAMTEKQGGSDVRANATRAVALEVAGEFELTGHKWFCSAPMSDAFITLAQTPNGLSCFFVPRWRPDGTRNPFLLQRLKDKLGDRSNASCEIEYLKTWGMLIGDEGHGVRAIMDMVHQTRLDTMLAAAGMMRQALVQAIHHTSHRRAFQRVLADQPLMRNVLADLVIDWAASTMMAARIARSFDEAAHDPAAKAFSRIAVAFGKYWVNKRLPGHVCEAMECLGGSGYVEESMMPRLYRQAPVNGIWEGSGNVICLDVLRSMQREPLALETLFAEYELARGGDRRLDTAIDRLKAELHDRHEPEMRARRITEIMAVLLQCALVVRHGPAAVADAFCASRLDGNAGATYGTLASGTDFDNIIKLGRVLSE